MKSGRSLSELAIEIERQSEVKRDFKAPTTAIEVIPAQGGLNLGLKTNGHTEQFPVNDLAHTQIAEHVGIPQKYYDRMRSQKPELLATNVRTWFDTAPQTRMIRTLDGNARAFLSNRYRTLDNFEVAKAVLPYIIERKHLRVESTEITEKRLYIKVFDPSIEATIKGGARKVGEIVWAGASITNSEVGLHAFRVDPMIEILSCTNGARIPMSGMRKYHVGRHGSDAETAYEVFADDTRKADDQALMLKMRDIVRAAFDEVKFRETAKMLSATMDNRITKDVDEVIDGVQEMFALPQSFRSGILSELVKAGDLSQWGMSNAITALANSTVDYEQATMLENVGGDILAMDRKHWNELAA